MSSTTDHQPPGSTARFEDATRDLLEACSRLRLGQMVTIMDARMDSGMELPDDELPETDRIPASLGQLEYDPLQPLDGPDVVWIMDRLLACEAAWHLGRALSQTIYTCLYFHDLQRMSVQDAAYHAQASTSTPAPAPELRSKVLRAFIVATVKTCDLAWNELTKQNVYDGEDFSGDKSGLGLLEGTEPRYALALLDDALEWLSADPTLSDDIGQSLKARLSLRKQLLSATMLLAEGDPAALIEVSLHCRFAKKHLAALRPHDDDATAVAGQADTAASPPCIALQDPGRQKAPSTRSMASFDPAYNRKLVANAPLRPIALPSARETWTFLEGLLDGLQEVVQLLQRPDALGWKMFFSCHAYSFQARQTSPYIRSLYQSAVCDRNMVAGRLPLDWLTQNFFAETAQVDPLLLRRLSSVGQGAVEGGRPGAWNAPPSLGQSANYFSQRIAGHLVSYLTTLSQNRSRQKRSLAKAYAQWMALAEEASQLGKRIESVSRPEDYMPDSLFAGVQHAALDVTLQVVLSGFELDLYRRDEWAGIYFVASRICSEQALVCEGIRTGLLDRRATLHNAQAATTIHYLASQEEMARALEAAAVGTVLLLHALEPNLQPRPWPLSTRTDDPALAKRTAALAKATFAARLKWLELPSARQSRQSIDDLWDELSAFQAGVRSLSAHDCLAEAEANWRRAVDELQLWFPVLVQAAAA
ncbi:uncharacterized protein PSFLO_03677 [Pseudozyma flocculosa]|uniref:Uncharacterized protein n=1 Tax=Pseudozyma flocculosa TaxID=84751 RepID=A0A5C3F296_9BASI|nr:uncharacterized protein PSFLO_03677 [Pseudozyma flocculosa]